MSLKKLWGYLVFFILILSIYFFILNWSKSLNQSNLSTDTVETSQVKKTESDRDKKVYYKVIRIVDGDTIVVFSNDKEEKVRMLGINTPESVAKNREDECFGEEASFKTKELLLNKKVFLEFDKAKPERDEYGRLLSYVFREDGLFVSRELINLGFAYEYTYKKQFKEAESYAKANRLGLWATSTCNGLK